MLHKLEPAVRMRHCSAALAEVFRKAGFTLRRAAETPFNVTPEALLGRSRRGSTGSVMATGLSAPRNGSRREPVLSDDGLLPHRCVGDSLSDGSAFR
jgi:hypothetical protein